MWLFFLTVDLHVFAQAAPPAPPSFTFRYENDFFSATDKYYTQGVLLEYSASFIKASPATRLLLRLRDGQERHSFFAEQNCFTPSSIRRDTILTGDHPFAAALFVGQRLVSADPVRGIKLTSTLELGAMGPCAICAEEQRGIHRALHNIEPLGWQFQVAGDVIVNYDVEVQKRLFRLPFAEASVGASTELGTYRTNVVLDGDLELGHFDSGFDGRTPGKGFRASAFLNGRVKAVGYDASLQGGILNSDSPYVLSAGSIERAVLVGGGGVRFGYHRLSLDYSRTFTTREFAGGTDHGWGTLFVQIRL